MIARTVAVFGLIAEEIDKIIEKSIECVLDKYTNSDGNHTPAIRRIYFNVP
ncbi:hypothetical protein FORC065_2299 [Yersinia enterocolitica]|nr:hypothetical protein FORC065_2299 [Yersinia enterocolitica]